MRQIPFAPPDISQLEIDEVIDTLKSGWITTGKKTKLLEQNISDYIGTSKAVCLSSQTSAMEMTLRILGVGPGDEVIVPAYTYTASASVITHVGATIVMIDIAPDTFELDYQAIADAITEKTKVIIPVDIGGRMCDYDKVFAAVEKKRALFHASNELQKKYDRVIVCSDSAQGFGSSRKGNISGQAADFTTFSFHAVKNITTAEGGAVTWRDVPGLDNQWLYQQYMLYSLHGQTKDSYQKSQLGNWEYDIIYPAYKCNMTDIQAALGLKQLERYPSLLQRRKEIIARYDKAFLPLGVKPILHYDEQSCSNGHLYLVRIPGISMEQRNELIWQMNLKGISCNVHFKPLPLMTAYQNLGFDIQDYPVSYQTYCNEITLPLHTSLTDEDVEYIIEQFCDLVLVYIQ